MAPEQSMLHLVIMSLICSMTLLKNIPRILRRYFCASTWQKAERPSLEVAFLLDTVLKLVVDTTLVVLYALQFCRSASPIMQGEHHFVLWKSKTELHGLDPAWLTIIDALVRCAITCVTMAEVLI